MVAGGDALLAPAITRRLIATFVAPAAGPPPPGLDTLTTLEREVVAFVADGLSTMEIAERLGMSPATAKTHTNRAMTKLGARDRAQLVVFAYRFGLARRYQALGNFLRDRGDPHAAARWWRKAVPLAEALRAADKLDGEPARLLAELQTDLARVTPEPAPEPHAAM